MSKIDEIRAEMVKAMKEKDKERKDSLHRIFAETFVSLSFAPLSSSLSLSAPIGC